jgi:hypothetical protein
MEKEPMMYQQRTLDFEGDDKEPQRLAEATSKPPPADQAADAALPLVRPDRQIVFPDAPNHYHWPDAKQLHDHDTISVDRIVDDCDGPAHRFVIKRGDTVKAYLSQGKFHVGEVLGISHARQEVRVAWDESREKGGWFHVGRIYPAAQGDRVLSPRAPVTANAIVAWLSRHPGQEYSAGDLRDHFACPALDRADPLANPVHQALCQLRKSGQVHVVESRGGEPRFSVLDLPATAAELTLAHCPQTLAGPEIRRLFTKYRRTIAGFAQSVGFTQKHVREVLERGLQNQNAIRDWLEALLPGQAAAGASPTVAQPQASYTLEEFEQFHREFSRGAVSFAEYRSQFERLAAASDALRAELPRRYNAKQLSVLASRLGAWDAKRHTKEGNARTIVARMLASFVLDDVVSYRPLGGETYEEAVCRKVRAVSEGAYYRHFEQRQAADLAHEKALTAPETLSEFSVFVTRRGEQELSDEQLARYDALRADVSRQLRASQAPATVAKFQSEELAGIGFQVKEGFHDKRRCPLWIVQLETRVEREAFNELSRKAKLLGGWYSSFKQSDAGFQFLSQESADRFCSLLAGDVDRSQTLEARKTRQEQSAAERLHELAKELFDRAAETLERSHAALQNTARRADLQAGVRGRAFVDQALSRSLHSIAEALSRGEAKYLDGIRHKTHLETLESVLQRAAYARRRAQRPPDSDHDGTGRPHTARLPDAPLGLETVRFAKYPYPQFYRRTLQELIAAAQHTRGVKLAAQKVQRRLPRDGQDFVAFTTPQDIEAMGDFVERAKAAGLDADRAAQGLQEYKRLQRAAITDVFELRAALREYLGHRFAARGDDPVTVAERELIGQDLPGFFPTPPVVIERLLELAQVQAWHRVLEPSCGKGDMLDALMAQHPDLAYHAIELNHTLAEVLAAKGYRVQFADFLAHDGVYDRIVMNPPFEDGQDMRHVQHAYALLAAGGRLVSVVSEGPFFRSDRQSSAFRQWLEQVGAKMEPLPEEAFAGRDAFRQTSVRTRLLTIDKE